MKKVCFLFGNRYTPGIVFLQIQEAVERAYNEFGIRETTEALTGWRALR